LYQQYSPDGKLLAYISYSRKINKGIELYVADRHGNAPKKITDSGAMKFSWSPNSQEIVYLDYKAGFIDEGKGALWVVNLQTMAKRQLTFNKFTLIQ
jgi:Tol biopolymer transport system component